MAQLKIDRGTRYTIGVTFQKNGEAQSLVGATVRFTMKPDEWDSDANDTNAPVRKDVTNGNSDGLAEIVILPADTATLEPGNYVYDIKVDEQSNGQHIYKLDEGKVKLDGSPTNRLS